MYLCALKRRLLRVLLPGQHHLPPRKVNFLTHFPVAGALCINLMMFG